MTRLAFLPLAALLMWACARPVNTAESALQYLQKVFPDEVFEVSAPGEIRPIYTPFNELISMRIQAASASSYDDLGAEFADPYREISVALDDLGRYSDQHPDICDRTGFPATVKRKGRKETVWFILERDGSSIGHCSLEMEQWYNEITHRLASFSYGW